MHFRGDFRGVSCASLLGRIVIGAAFSEESIKVLE